VIGLVILLVFALAPTACVDRDDTRTTLDAAGYTDITTGDYAWFECGRDDTYATRFTARNPAGKRVSGTVCCGLMKGCTIRF
jgi:hypothetical protein